MGVFSLTRVFLEDSPSGFAGAGGLGDQALVNFRLARLRADGTMYGTYDWGDEYDFVNNVNVDPTLPASESNIEHETGTD